jgi:HPt (histidine-containing phosphotransfer) domain-containing protein/HAMP domain-containing protein
MRNTIWKKTLFFVVLPFLAIFAILSFIIVQSAVEDKNRQAELDLRNLARLNEVNFLGVVNSVRISIMTAEAELEKIDSSLPDARKRGEGILLSMMENRHIYNAWLAYEPMAFDGRDPEHGGDYPGAPSGRYMRSFVRSSIGYQAAFDMDESTIDDPLESAWYVAPRERGRPCIDLSSNVMYDYNDGEGVRNVAAVSMPIYRNGMIIGCLGADILFDQMILGHEIFPDAVSAIFSPGYGIIHAMNKSDVGKSLDSLGFRNPGLIKSAFNDERELYLRREYSHFFEKDAFIYFKPIFIEGFDELLYLYAAMPANAVVNALFPLLAPIISSLLIALISFIALIHYLRRTITKPMHSLTLAADAISRGDIGTEMKAICSSDEIGVMSLSLRRMVEQFRMYRAMMEREEERLRLYKLVNEEAYRQDSIRDAFDSIVHDICLFFEAHKGSLVFVTDGRPKVLSRYEMGMGFSSELGDQGADFPFHAKVAETLGGKKILFMNKYAMAEKKIDFTDWLTASVCILPIYTGENLRGYFILEKKHSASAFSGDDSSLIFVSEMVSYIIAQKEVYEGSIDRRIASQPERSQESVCDHCPQLPEAIAERGKDLPIIAGARMISGLDVDAGVSLLGGSQARYVELLRVSNKTFSASIQKLEAFLPRNLRGFAIEVHGTKGALFNIGAKWLGERAQELENAAKEEDVETCLALYENFRKSLGDFAEKLAAIVTEDAGPREPGSLEDLATELPRAKARCLAFDSFAALDILSPLARRKYDAPGRWHIEGTLDRLIALLEDLEYDEALKEMTALSDMLGCADS